MIEILDIQDADQRLEITPELEVAAYNILRRSCKQHGDDCGGCGLCAKRVWCCPIDGTPDCWPDLEVRYE